MDANVVGKLKQKRSLGRLKKKENTKMGLKLAG
jgi:hypothetical protein